MSEYHMQFGAIHSVSNPVHRETASTNIFETACPLYEMKTFLGKAIDVARVPVKSKTQTNKNPWHDMADPLSQSASLLK